MREKCLELLADSARASANKLKFFRLAFGAAGGFGAEIDTREAEAVLEGLFGAERRIELGWAGRRADLAQGRGQAAAQPRACWPAMRWSAAAGSMSAPSARDDAIEIVIRAEGPRILLDPSFARPCSKAWPAARSSRAPPAPGWRTPWRQRRAARIQLGDPPTKC